MFNIKIKENIYTVYGENEFNFIYKNNVIMIGIPNYYNLNIENNGYLRITNNEPIIFPSDDLIKYNINEAIGIGYPIDINMYNILYKKYLEDTKGNLNKFDIQKKEIENDLNYIKRIHKQKNKNSYIR